MNLPCSIIIPVYNESSNLKTCFDSIKKQKYNNIEVIFIDDGSTDNSALLINNFISENNNLDIKYIYQKNSGAANARFNGINLTNSNYIVFLDCDDWLDDDSILLAMRKFEDNSIDLSLFDLYFVEKNNQEVKKMSRFIYYTNEKKITGHDGFFNSINSWGLHGCGIIKKSILLGAYKKYTSINNNNVNYINNDEIITRLCFLHSRYISLSSGKYYYYRNTNSTTKKINNNYHYIIFNSIILNQLIKSSDINIDRYISKSIDLLNRTTWGVFLRYVKWRSSIDKKSWKESIRSALNYYKCNSYNKKPKQLLKIVIMKLYLRLIN